MALRENVVKSGVSANTATAGGTQGTGATGLTATGTTQANAFALANDVVKFTTVAAGSGIILPTSNGGDCGSIFNGGANALLIYPPVGGQINNLAVNTAYSLATATPSADWYCIVPGIFMISQSA
jgi:hypothetical protein